MYLYMYIVFTVSQFHADVHSVYLVFLFDTTILSESMRMSYKIRPQIKRKQRTFQISLSLLSTYLFDFCMFAASVFIAMVIFLLCISFDLQKERTKERKKKEPFFSNRELLSTRKHWTINPSLAQAHHRHYRHIAFISFQLKISTPFRKLSKHKKIHCIQ